MKIGYNFDFGWEGHVSKAAQKMNTKIDRTECSTRDHYQRDGTENIDCKHISIITFNAKIFRYRKKLSHVLHAAIFVPIPYHVRAAVNRKL